MNAHHVIVAGGGVAGLEAVLAVHAQAGDRVAITLLEPSIELVDRPMLVARPFAAGHAQRTPIARIIGPTGAVHRRESLASVDTGAQTVTTERAPNTGSMPAYRDKLNDEQIAAVASFIRNSWGNAALAVGPDQVSAARAAH